MIREREREKKKVIEYWTVFKWPDGEIWEWQDIMEENKRERERERDRKRKKLELMYILYILSSMVERTLISMDVICYMMFNKQEYIL